MEYPMMASSLSGLEASISAMVISPTQSLVSWSSTSGEVRAMMVEPVLPRSPKLSSIHLCASSEGSSCSDEPCVSSYMTASYACGAKGMATSSASTQMTMMSLWCLTMALPRRLNSNGPAPDGNCHWNKVPLFQG